MSRPLRIHILGASGSGTTTLGRALATELALPFHDSDDIFWEPTDPPFTTKRPPDSRTALLAERTGGDRWVFSGSSMGWGDFLRPRFTHVLFLTLPSEPRLARLRAREEARYGARVRPGGDLHTMHLEFLEWAGQYDEGRFEGRSRRLHEKWLRDLPCPVLRLDGLLPTAEQAHRATKFFGRQTDAEVRELTGTEAARVADPFYVSLGRSARAQPTDVVLAAVCGGEVMGCVRYCEEQGTPLLRGMLIAETARKQGVGRKLLAAFDAFLRRRGAGDTFCLPHAHLESFYATIGFARVSEEGTPAFLRERLAKYRADGYDTIVMKRPFSSLGGTPGR